MAILVAQILAFVPKITVFQMAMIASVISVAQMVVSQIKKRVELGNAILNSKTNFLTTKSFRWSFLHLKLLNGY